MVDGNVEKPRNCWAAGPWSASLNPAATKRLATSFAERDAGLVLPILAYIAENGITAVCGRSRAARHRPESYHQICLWRTRWLHDEDVPSPQLPTPLRRFPIGKSYRGIAR
jgi:hypothetical protein